MIACAGSFPTSFPKPMTTTDDLPHEQQGVLALETGLGVLDALVAAGRPMMLKDIAGAAGMHPAKAHRYLVSFVRKGYVQQDAAGHYGLGASALRVGLSCFAQLDPVRLVMPLLDQLSVAVNESVLAAVWSNLGATVVQWRSSSRPVNIHVRLGSVLPMLNSATGRVFAAYLDEAVSGPWIAAELADSARAPEPAFPRSVSEVGAMRGEVRAAGIGTVRGELRTGVNAVAAPVFDHEGQLALVITSLGSDANFDVGPDSVVAAAVRRTAATLSHQLGFDPERPAPRIKGR
jgi:DNA-binding IclR family transcriptional regulator